MAGRFLFRKLSSRMSRSTSLLGACASASAAAKEPVTRRVWESGITNLRYLFNGASGQSSKVAPNLPATHAARYFNTLPCASAASGTGSRAIGMPSAITWKLASVNSVGGKRTFSSSTSTNDTISSKPKVPTNTAEWASKKAPKEADLAVAAWFAKKFVEFVAFGRYIAFLVGSWYLIFWAWISMMDSESSLGNQSTYEVQSGSHRCSSCCKCQSMD